MSRAADDATQRVEQLIALTERLTAIIAREAEALKAKRPSELSALQEEKTQITAAYMRESTALKRDKGQLALVDAELKAKLKACTLAFRDALEKLSGALARVRRVGEGLIRAIADDINGARLAAAPYSNGGMPAQPGRATFVPIALDKRI